MKVHLLIAEDNRDLRETITDRYARKGPFDVTAASSAATALVCLEQLIDRGIVPVVFTDHDMPPGANGVELSRAIRRKYGPTIPIVLNSGTLNEDMKRTAELAGVNACFDKAAGSEVIIEKIRQLGQSIPANALQIIADYKSSQPGHSPLP